MTIDADSLAQAAKWIASAEALVVTAGAGMGVDSGLPDFRGTEGFWRAYPPYRALNLGFENLASAELFNANPSLAWGFYGHRLQLYRETIPHEGFAILDSWWRRCPLGGFVFTSNVDGQFQRAGFPDDATIECHGSIHSLQEMKGSTDVWSADGTVVNVDHATMRASEPLPRRAGELLRPNILMFDDYGWSQRRYAEQNKKYVAWQKRVAGKSVVVVELGAGLAIPTVRRESERLVRSLGAKLIRINPRDPQSPLNAVSLPVGALSGLRMIRDGY